MSSWGYALQNPDACRRLFAASLVPWILCKHAYYAAKKERIICICISISSSVSSNNLRFTYTDIRAEHEPELYGTSFAIFFMNEIISMLESFCNRFRTFSDGEFPLPFPSKMGVAVGWPGRQHKRTS